MQFSSTLIHLLSIMVTLDREGPAAGTTSSDLSDLYGSVVPKR
jgi:hypothetical protein